MKEEIWKDIEGYEGMYEVSNLGRVKSLEREVNSNKKGKRIEKITARVKEEVISKRINPATGKVEDAKNIVQYRTTEITDDDTTITEP